MNKMMLYLQKNYSFYILIGLTLAFHFVSSEAFLIGIIVLSLFFVSLEIIYYKNNPFTKNFFIIIPLLLYLVLGLLMGCYQRYDLHNIIRDIFYHINTLAVIVLVLTIFTDKLSKEQLFWAFLIVGTFMGMYTLIRLKQYIDAGNEITYYGLRMLSNAGYLVNFVSVVSFLFIKKYKYVTIPLSIFNLIMAMISFSRVGIVLLICLFVFLSIYFIIFTKHKIYYLIFLILAGMVIIVLYFNTFVISDIMYRFRGAIVELNPFQNWNDEALVRSSWRGYEVWMILDKFKATTIIGKLFGSGFGAFIYSEYAIRSSSGEILNEIAIFHNGYFGALFKCGIVGLSLYLSFLLMLIGYSIKYIVDKKELFLNLALISYIFLASYVVMGLFHKEVWFPLVFMVMYLIKHYMNETGKKTI